MAKIASVPTKNGSTRSSNPGAKTILDETAEIQKLAYQFFIERGNEHGHDGEDWLRAERIIKARKKSQQ